MTEDPFVDDVYLPQLGLAAGFAIFGFRACAYGAGTCCAVARGFESAFAEDGPAALAGLECFVRRLGVQGGRRVRLAKPGCARVTPDELSFLGAFAAAQAGDAARRDAHLRWLFGGRKTTEAAAALDRAAGVFAAHRLVARPPDAAAPPPRPVDFEAAAGNVARFRVRRGD